MSSISEVYAKDLGVKIGKAKITEHFHPIPAEKYITFFKDDPSQVNQYEYWEVVLSLLNPIFQKYEIKGLEIYDNKNQSVKQNNFLIKNSELYLGIANHFMVTADIYKKPSVCLLPNSYSNNINSKYSKVITPDFSSIKPSFSAQEAKKRINEILPEDIAQSVLDKLNIKEEIKFKTIRIGSNYNQDVVEIVPNFFSPHPDLVNKNINIKSDIHFNKDNIIKWCRYSKVNLFLDQVIDDSTIDACTNLKQVIFNYSAKHEKIDLKNFIKKLKGNKIKFAIEVQDEELFSDVSLKYFDHNVIRKNNLNTTNIPDTECEFFSKKRFISNNNVFNSEFSSKTLDNSSKFVYNEISKLEIESLYLYVKK
jgi:hypothetical protein|tara:strand:+ start:5874 stop:6968 length:1095 start_codon:yes stop_codon:yes gene_type:complete